MDCLDYCIVTVPVAPVRKRPDHRLEMSNQLLFGESARILGSNDKGWLKIESLYDGYRGWLTHHLVTIVDRQTAAANCDTLVPGYLNNIIFNNQPMLLPLAASLRNFKNGTGHIVGIPYSFKGTPIRPASIENKRQALLEYAALWLNAPYLWGGKTILGVDCSGFCQTVFKLVGVPIARDAREQALQGHLVSSLKRALPGDLAFFEELGKITHVGLLLEPGQIIHAAGKVRKDPINAKGIVNSDTGVRTHRLKLIKRLLPA